ncbi:MAG: hypothetical protein FWE70_04910 [Oscillospiraceae bacterium]|nr:hypothetical protein [Oscillospiraceae bacterium]
MSFTTEIEGKAERYRRFHESPEPGMVLVTVPPYTFKAPPPFEPNDRGRRPPAEGRFPDAEKAAEGTVSFIRHYARQMDGVGCDYIPCASPGYGIALGSVFLSGAEVIPGLDTNWVHPVVHGWDDLNNLRFDPGNAWVGYMRRFMERAGELCDGDYCVGMLSAFAPCDMANALRGNDLFYDLHDEPAMAERLLAVCADANVALYKELSPLTLAPFGGFCAAGLWMPGGGMFMSEDAADLCSPEVYRRFYGPQTQRAIDGMGGAYIHHHAKGWHVHGEISRLSGVRFIEISWDPKCPRPVDRLDEFLELSLTTPLQIRCTLADLKARIGQMRQGRVAVMVNVDTVEEAAEAVRVVRANSVM